MGKAFRPLSLDEALQIADTHSAIPLAGGTDLMVQQRTWAGLPPRFDAPVMFVGHLPELQGIRIEGDRLIIASGTTLASILQNDHVPSLLREAVRSIGGPAIRSRATLGGNICNASPAADTLPPLYVLGAHLMLRSKTGERSLPAESFIQGPGQTVLGKGELLTAVSIPAEGPDIDFFRKVGTRASNALSKLSIAATASVGQGVVKEVRLALGAVAPTVVRSAEAEELMTGKTASQVRRDLYRILDAYNGMIHPIDDQRSSSLYRLKASFRLILSFIGTVLLPAVEQHA